MGQGWSSNENSFEKNWNVTFQLGGTTLLNELNSDFSVSSNDMNNLTDWCLNLQIAKMVWNRVDLGLEFSVSNYKGYNNNPTNVNMLMLHSLYNNYVQDFQPYPIYYDSDLTSFALFGKYNFTNFSNWARGYIKLNIYVKMGIGISFPSAELGYKDLSNYEFTGLTHPLYLKGRYPQQNKDAHSFINTALGFNYQLSDRIFLSAEPSVQFINTDNLDGIHNYNNSLTSNIPINQTGDYRIKVYGMTARFLFGLSYFFNFDTHRQMRQKYLPWYSMRFRSYYSKFQTGTSKKDRQERIPFYNDNLDDKK